MSSIFLAISRIKICCWAIPCCLLLANCVDPVQPEFDFKEDLIFVDGIIVTVPGASSITLQKSRIVSGDNFVTVGLEGANVTIQEINQGETVVFKEDGNGVYSAPVDFAPKLEESWQLRAALPDGQILLSEPESVTTPIGLDNISQTFSPEVVFDESYDRFIPGHSITVDWTDPAGKGNYYLMTYRTFEPLEVCNTCERSIWRMGKCTQTRGYFRPYYNYLCDQQCWQIRTGTEIKVFSDDLVDGTTVKDFPLVILPYYRSVDILVEVQQLSISQSAYDYYKVIDNLTNNNGGLNAPPPAALLGNIYDPNDENAAILGNFTVAAAATKQLYIDRSEIGAIDLTPDRPLSLEPCQVCPDSIVFFVCEEGRFRTAVRPEGWKK